MALIDELRKRLQQQQAQQPAPIDVQGTLQTLAQAKTGRAAAGPVAPAASSIGQDVAQQQVASQMAQQQLQVAGSQQQLEATAQQQQTAADIFRQRLATEQAMAQKGLAIKGTLAGEQLAGNEARALKQLSSQEENKLNAVSSSYKNNLNALASERQTTVDDIFESFRQDTAELEMRKDGAQLEQMAFQAALANKSYLQELEAIGKTRMLTNDLNFKKEYTTIKLGEEMSSILQQFGWQSAFDADEREAKIQLGTMDIDQAIAVANAAIMQANTQAVASGAASVAKSYTPAPAARSAPAPAAEEQ